jgi:hypothetical protein
MVSMVSMVSRDFFVFFFCLKWFLCFLEKCFFFPYRYSLRFRRAGMIPRQAQSLENALIKQAPMAMKKPSPEVDKKYFLRFQ